MVFYLTPEEKTKIMAHYNNYRVVSKNPHCEAFFVFQDINISVYKDKVVFQGNKAQIIQEYRQYWNIFDEKELYIIGNDEVGTGDYFGPVVVASCYIGFGDMEKLRNLNIRDSKTITNQNIITLANQIMKIVVFEAVIVNNRRYNQWIGEGFNANVIKAWAHNQVLVKMLQHKVQYQKIIIDQFTPEQNYFDYLNNSGINKNKIINNKVQFLVRAEYQYLAVACAAIISRYLFLNEIQKISKELNTSVPLGAGKNVDEFLSLIKIKLGVNLEKFLNKNCKMHFANTKRIK